MMNDCPICGRNHVITYPEFWPYRRQETLFCSDQCMDIYDVQLMNKKNGWVQGSKKKGKNTMGYTKIKKDGSLAKKSGPKPKNAKAQDDAVTKAALQHPERPIVAPISPVIMESVEDGFTPEEIDMIKKGVIPATDDQKKFVDMLNGNETIEMPKAEEVIPKELQKHMKPGVLKKREKKFSLPSICNGFEVVGIRGQYGVYRANDEVNYFDFQPFGGELCMSPEEWHEQLDELKRAAKVLGVEL